MSVSESKKNFDIARDRIIICMKWGSLYPVDYVNVLYNACKTHTTEPFRFVCLTDEPAGIDEGVETFPIPDIGLTASMWKSGAWAKLSVFQKNLYGLSGRALFLDLDTVVNGWLDPFFEYKAPFVTIDTGEGWTPKPQPTVLREVGTGVFAFNLGKEHQILDRFTADPDAVVSDYTIEQKWVGATASSMDYWPDGWVISFKKFLRRPIGVDLILPPKSPPSTAKVIAFHGKPRPADLLKPGSGFWDRFPHMGHGSVTWMVDYWKRNGGRWPLA